MLRPHDRRVVQRLARLGLMVLWIVLLMDLFISHKPHFAAFGLSFDTWPMFHPLLGFLSTMLLVSTAKTLGILLSRPETHYAAS